MSVAVVQGGAAPAERAERPVRLARYVELTRNRAALDTGLIVWPESAIESYLEEASPTRDAVLRVANEVSRARLDDEAGLSEEAAASIVEARPFSSLAELDDAPYVGRIAFDKLARYARDNGYVPDGLSIPEEMLGKVLTAIFELDGQRFMALDGGPIFKFNEAISLYVSCADQAEVDYFYEKLSAVPEAEVCGWCKDKYGLSWQIIPEQMGELLSSPDREKALAATNAMLKMKKIIIADLQKAYDEA